MMEIELTQGKIALIDDEDWPLVAGFKWSAYKDKNTWYVMANSRHEDGSRTHVKMHRVILGLTDSAVHVDHRDGNGLNNRRENLRVCTNGENARNRGAHANNKIGLKGVSWHKRAGKWVAQIMIGGKKIHLGYFLTTEEAHAAYCAAAANHHGSFANFGAPQPKKVWCKPSFEYVS